MKSWEKECIMCNGKGYILDEGAQEPCLECDGSGAVPKYQSAGSPAPVLFGIDGNLVQEVINLKVRIQHLKDAIRMLQNYQPISYTNKCGDTFLDNQVCKTCEVYQECLGRDMLIKALRQAEIKYE
jgi:RecJ-like exonuclease